MHEFGICGAPTYCLDRLIELTELGIHRFILTEARNLLTRKISSLGQHQRLVSVDVVRASHYRRALYLVRWHWCVYAHRQAF